MAGVKGLDELGDAAGHEDLAVAEGDKARVPPAVVHGRQPRPLVPRRDEDPRLPDSLQLDEALVRPGEAGLAVVVGAACGQHLAVAQEDLVGTEQAAVVVAVVGGSQRRRQGQVLSERCVVRPAVGGRGSGPPGSRRREGEEPGLVIHGKPAAVGYGADGEALTVGAPGGDVLGPLQGVPVEDPPVGELDHGRPRRRDRGPVRHAAVGVGGLAQVAPAREDVARTVVDGAVLAEGRRVRGRA